MLRMNFPFRFCACTAALMIAIGVGRAADQSLLKAGEAEMSTPAGWSVDANLNGRLVLKRTDNGQLSAIVIASEPFHGSLSDAVRSTMHRGFTDEKLALKNLREDTSIFGFPGVSFDESFRHAQLKQRLQISGLGLNVDGRLHLAWMVTPANKATEQRGREFEQLIRNWRFKQRIATTWDPTKPRKVPAHLAGFYFGSKIQNRYNGLSGILEMKAVREHVVLLTTGQAYRGIPPGGRVLDMNFAELLREDPNRCGVYSVDGDEIVFEWPASLGMVWTARESLLSRGGAARFRFRGVDISPMKPVPRLRLEGRYTSSNVTTAGAGSSSTSVSADRTLTFTRDGRYTKSRFVGVAFSHESGEGRTGGAGISKPAQLTGTYVIEGFRLTLTPDEGPPENFTVIIETPGVSPSALFINGAAYLKSGG
jgi:hypothetical protein